MRLYAGIVLLAALLAVIAVFGGGGRPTPEVNRIVYVSLDAQIRSIRPDGSDPRQISPDDGFFTWPTWSPDARRVVFSGVVGDRTRSPEINLYSFEASTGEIREIYTGERGVAGILAEGVVHYPLWSPDGKRVAFVAITSRGLTLFLDDLEDDPEAEYILDQGPLWMSWSHDSMYLKVHRGNEHFLVNTFDGIQVRELKIGAFGGYRVPAWKPHEDTVTVVSEKRRDEYTLYTANVTGGDIDVPQAFAEVTPDPAVFLWSPGGEYLAVAGSARVFTYRGLNTLTYRNLTLLSGGSNSAPIEIKDDVLAYFWSPDGEKLAYLTLSNRRGVLSWMVFDLEDRSRRTLLDFIPSRDQMTMFQFFDQYAYSHSLWSPDSRSLVFAGRLVTGAVTASTSNHPGHQASHVIVVDTGPDPSPEFIADGILGFWSPR